MGRRPCCGKVGLNKGGWDAVEDQILLNYIKANGEGKWRDLPKNAGLKRCGKSCRLRWLNYLNPKIIRGNISQEEEELIINLQKQLGNSWSLIAARLPGRTDNEIKNYWNTILGKKVHGVSVVPKRKRKKQTNGKSNSNSVPRRGNSTIPPTSIHNTNSKVTDTPALISETTAALEIVGGNVPQARTCGVSHQLLSPNDIRTTLQNITNIEALPQLCLSPENNFGFMDNIMQYIDYVEVPQSQQLVSSLENDPEFLGDMTQDIEVPRWDVHFESGPSQGNLYGKCYTPQQSGASLTNCTEFLEGMHDIESPAGHVYGKWYHDLMSDMGTEEICMPDLDQYSMHTYHYQDILSELTFSSHESMSEHSPFGKG